MTADEHQQQLDEQGLIIAALRTEADWAVETLGHRTAIRLLAREMLRISDEMVKNENPDL